MEKKRNILIVEDEAIVGLEINDALLQLGYSVSAVCASGEEALEALITTRPDLVLMDIKLQGDKDGIETAELIHKQYNIPIVYMTAHSEESTIEKAKLTEPYGYLLKPVDKNELHIAIAVALYKSKIDEEKLQFTKELGDLRYKHLLESITGYIYTTTVERGWPVRTVHGEGCFAISGYTPEDYETDPLLWSSIIYDKDRKAVSSELARFMKERYGRTFEHRLVHRNGSIIWVRNTLVPNLDVKGELVGYDGIVNNISERKQLEKNIAEISARERNCIGQQLHDDVGQILAGTAFLCKSLEKKLKNRYEDEDSDIIKITENINESIRRIRAISKGVSSFAVTSDGIYGSLKNLAVSTEKTHHVTCSFESPDVIQISDSFVNEQLYYIAGEAVSNALRHSRSENINIALIRNGPEIILTVEDDGVGFDPYKTGHDGIGLRIMKYRASMIGAYLDISRTANNRTIVSCCVHL
jgi:PAS domain S-box-containing protein